MARVRIFVDYWNFQLNVRDQKGKDYRPDWQKISPWLMAKAQSMINYDLVFEETRVYLSYNPHSKEDKKLKDWACNTLDCFPGIQVVIKERILRHPAICPACHEAVTTCPSCGVEMKGTVEKGVDTALVTDLLSLAWENTWDVAILVSSDQDFIPAVQMLDRKGFKVISARFSHNGMDLARYCWASIDLRGALDEIQLTRHGR